MTFEGDERRRERRKMLTEQEVRQIAEKSSDAAVKKVFAILGVDIDEPKEVASFQDDLRFGRRLRKAADKGFLAFAGVGGIAIAYALWDGIIVAAKRVLGMSV